MIRRRTQSLLFCALLAGACAGFVALGDWQLHRRAWKLDLIARVNERLRAPASAAPSRQQWPAVNAVDDEYRRVCADGRLLNRLETLVQAVTRLGPGHWVMTPLQRDDGTLVLINRGFVDADHRDPDTRPSVDGPVHLCGLLRITEPGGAFLHHNDPLSNRWYSRDVAAITLMLGLDSGAVAPYFIDADAGSGPAAWPVGGLTVVQFRNSHLSYALTWFGLALLSAGGLALVLRQERRSRVQSTQQD